MFKGWKGLASGHEKVKREERGDRAGYLRTSRGNGVWGEGSRMSGGKACQGGVGHNSRDRQEGEGCEAWREVSRALMEVAMDSGGYA